MSTSFLRLGLAIVVIAFHSGYPYGGPFAVLAFYVLSGGVSAYLLQNHSPFRFLARRVRSLLPPFVVVAIVHLSLVLYVNRGLADSVEFIGPINRSRLDDPWGLLTVVLPQMHVTLWPLRLGGSSEILPLYWTVLNEFVLYAIAASLCALSLLRRNSILVLLMPVTVIFIIYSVASRNDLGLVNANIYFNALAGVWFFLLGMAIFHLVPPPKIFLGTGGFLTWLPVIVLLATLTVAIAPLTSTLGRFTSDPALIWVWSAVLVALLATFQIVVDRNSLVHARKRPAGEQYISRLAYLVYIWQVPSFTFVLSILKPSGAFSTRFNVFLLILIFTLIPATIHGGIERSLRIRKEKDGEASPLLA